MVQAFRQILSDLGKLFLGLFVKSPVEPVPTPQPEPVLPPTPAPPPNTLPPPPTIHRDGLGNIVQPGTGHLAALDAFVKRWTGHYIDYDHVYGFQCVDLVKQYIAEVLGRTPIAGNAINVYGGGGPGWKWILNDIHNLKQIPPKGSIVIFHSGGGIPAEGHNSVILSADAYHFVSFDQNWPVGHAPQQVRHDYTYVKGYGVPVDRMGRSVLS